LQQWEANHVVKTGTMSTVELRRQNRNRVFRGLMDGGEPLTKQDLAAQLGMSMPTLSQNLKELEAMGLVENSGTTGSTGGRKPRLLSLVPEARFAVGIELSSNSSRIIAIDLKCNQLAFALYDDCPFANTEAAAKDLANRLEGFLDAHDLSRERLLGVGITVPGIVNAQQTLIEYAPTAMIDKMSPIWVNRYIPYPSFLDNDATCGGYAEWWNHAEKTNMAYISLCRGIGGAILVNGSAYGGDHQRSAEFGHMCIHPGGRVCNCGKRGCFEAYCSATRLSGDLHLTIDEFFAGLKAGNPAYQNTWNTYLDDLALAVGSIHTMLDCNIVIGGAFPQYLAEYQKDLEERLGRLNPFSDEGNYVHFCRYHDRSTCVGAALRYIAAFVDQV
jgi:predicted NBD/HSP70 family sugar kinase